MKIKTPNPEYLEKAKLLTDEEADRLHSRMSGKLPRRRLKDKVSSLEALAIQLELEDEQLNEWREALQKIREKDRAKEEKDKAKEEKDKAKEEKDKA
ncbi:MAG: hypothetical protein ABL885_13380 [Methylophilaceae bacterium]